MFICLRCINRLVFEMNTQCVFCDVETQYFSIIEKTFPIREIGQILRFSAIKGKWCVSD